MKLPAFDYACPDTLADVTRLLADGGGDARLLAGGQSLVPVMAFRLAAPSLLVDLRRVPDLRAVEIDATGVRLGAMVRWCDIEADRALASALPLLPAAVRHVAHYQVKNRGTIGGSLGHADPASEFPGVAVTCDATIEIVSAAGRRDLPAAALFTGPLETCLAADDVIVAVRFPAWPAARRWAFEEFSRRPGDFALAAISLFYDTAPDGAVADAHIGVIGRDGRAAAPSDRRSGAPRAPARRGRDRRRSGGGDGGRRARQRPSRQLGLPPLARRHAARPRASHHAARGGVKVAFQVNGRAVALDVAPRMTLADCLRDAIDLTGTHVGCAHGVCGACTIIVDGEAVRGCLVLAVQADGAAITTVEGLAASDGELSPLQRAFKTHHGLQCGFCTPGMLTTLHALLTHEPEADADRIREVISGNLCRCTGYVSIVEAALDARAAYRAADLS